MEFGDGDAMQSQAINDLLQGRSDIPAEDGITWSTHLNSWAQNGKPLQTEPPKETKHDQEKKKGEKQKNPRRSSLKKRSVNVNTVPPAPSPKNLRQIFQSNWMLDVMAHMHVVFRNRIYENELNPNTRSCSALYTTTTFFILLHRPHDEDNHDEHLDEEDEKQKTHLQVTKRQR